MDQRIKYIPALIRIAATVHIQNKASIVERSQGPAFGTPYWQIFMRMVPMLHGRQRSQSLSRGLSTYETSLILLAISRSCLYVGVHVLTEAGMNRDSNLSVKECVKLPGRKRNLARRRAAFVANKQMLKTKKMTPTI